MTIACTQGSAVVAEALLRHGCGINDDRARDVRGMAPLHVACGLAVHAEGLLSGRLVQTLLKHGAMPNIRANNDASSTALHILLASMDGRDDNDDNDVLHIRRVADIATAIVRCGGRTALKNMAGGTLVGEEGVERVRDRGGGRGGARDLCLKTHV